MTNDNNRDAYLNLLAEVVLNRIYKDAPISPGHEKKYVPEYRDNGKDWPANAHTMIGAKRLLNIRFALETVVREGIEGDFIETGVWRGGACIFARGVLNALGSTKKVYVADSFAGLPRPDPEKYPVDLDDKLYTYETLAVSRAEVEANFDCYGLLDSSVEFIEGYFEETLPNANVSTLSVVRLDGDMYSSTIVALESLYSKLSEGGFLIIDDYGAIHSCRKAVEDFRTAYAIKDEMHLIDWTGVYWRKGRD